MSKKRSDVFAETIVGIFMAAVLALLVYFTIVISGVDILVGHTKVPMKVEFADVGGLKDRDSVMYRGMKVGVIDHIDLSKTNVVMTVRVTSDVVLREGYRISVASLSLLGGNYLLLEEGAGKPLPLDYRSADRRGCAAASVLPAGRRKKPSAAALKGSDAQ